MTVVRLHEASPADEIELALNQAIGRTYRYNFRLAIGLFMQIALALIASIGLFSICLWYRDPVTAGGFMIGVWILLLIAQASTVLGVHFEHRRAQLQRYLESYRRTGDLQPVLKLRLNATYRDEE
ncbi:MAG: hypothetical protein Q7J73_11235 [Dehalococcoidales bacterium]|nr:hypothetical protein [Dehalococcoidales bacterium]